MDDQNALVPAPTPDPNWRPIFQASNQVVLYNPTSHALSIQQSSTIPVTTKHIPDGCPYCNQTLPMGFIHPSRGSRELDSDDFDEFVDNLDEEEPEILSREPNYFHLLAISNQSLSRQSTPPPISASSNGNGNRSAFSAEAMAEGYFKAFFKEEVKLGMGANGSVYLCQHVLDGNRLGRFAVKKIAVGQSHTYLMNTLREVRLLERLHHPNIITYHHAWLESCQFSLFGPKVPTLHLLMQWAEGGSLDDYIDARLGIKTHNVQVNAFDDDASVSEPATPGASSTSIPNMSSKSARIRAFRAMQQVSPEERERLKTGKARQETWKPIHLLSATEVLSLFRDVVDGLAFLHDKSILHLDLKPGNVLLTYDEESLIPRAMLSDFGTSRDMISSGIRSGNTGTLEYTSPESLPSPQTGFLQQVDSKADMWSLGMILHKLLFFRLPYRYASGSSESASALPEDEKLDRLEREVVEYEGFRSNETLQIAFQTRKLPQAYLVLLENLLTPIPTRRPSCERVASAIRNGTLNPVTRTTVGEDALTLVPITRRPSDEGKVELETENAIEVEENKESIPVLGLPLPDTIDGKVAGNTSKGMTMLKSILLTAKVLHVSNLCMEDSRANSALLAVTLALALLDTWLDGLWPSVGLAVLHVSIVRFTCMAGHCC